MDRLTPISPGVVHSSPHRTRLKAARWQDATASDIDLVKDALARVPGVTEVRPLLRGFVIEHESRPDVVENIGMALADVSPVLLEDLTADPARARKKKGGRLDGAFESLKEFLPPIDFSLADLDLSSASLEGAGQKVKKAVPAVLAGAGALLLLEGEGILAGVGPLALFYWAFDFNWKMRQEKVLEEVSSEKH